MVCGCSCAGPNTVTEFTTPISHAENATDPDIRGWRHAASVHLRKWLGKESISRDAAAVFALNMFSAAAGMVTTLILAKVLGAANYGVYAVVIVYANIFAFAACLGFPQLIVRTRGRYKKDADQTALKSIYATATLCTVIAAGLLAIAGSYMQNLLLPVTSSEPGWAMMIAMALVVPIALQRLNEARLLGCHQPILSALPERALRPAAMMVAVIVVVFILPHSVRAHHAALAQAFAIVLALVATVYFLRRIEPTAPPAIGTFDISLLRDSLPLLFVGMTTLLAGRIDIIMLSALTDAQAVGQYRLAYQIASLVLMVTTVSQAVLSPRLSRQHGDGTLAAWSSRLPKISAVLFTAALTVAIGVYAAFQVALPWIGADFANADTVLIILLAAFAISAAFAPALPMLTMTGNARYAAIANVGSLVLNTALNFVLIPQFGGTGAAISTAVSLIVLCALYSSYARRALR